jgi:hypothetical protein
MAVLLLVAVTLMTSKSRSSCARSARVLIVIIAMPFIDLVGIQALSATAYRQRRAEWLDQCSLVEYVERVRART